jgi:C-terminal processing protease CtpA/Prc
MFKYVLTAAALLALWCAPSWAQREDADQRQRDDQQQRDQSQHRDQTQQHTQQTRAYLGATIETNPEEGQGGAMVIAVAPNSPAAKAGLKKGDVITKIDNKDIHSFEDLTNVIRQHRPGDQLNMHVQRSGQDKTLSVALAPSPTDRSMERSGERYGQDQGNFGQGRDRFNRDRQDTFDRDQGQFGQRRFGQRQGEMARGRAFLGVQTEDITPELRRQFDLAGDQGVVVIDVVPDSPAAHAGLRNGDVITRVDGRDIMSPDDLRRAIMQMNAGQDVNLDIMRGNNHRKMTAQLEQNRGDFAAPGAGQRRYGEFDQGPGQDTIQRLQQRIDQLERRLRALEQNQRGGTPR